MPPGDGPYSGKSFTGMVTVTKTNAYEFQSITEAKFADGSTAKFKWVNKRK